MNDGENRKRRREKIDNVCPNTVKEHLKVYPLRGKI